MVTIYIKTGFSCGCVIHNHDVHIAVEYRCNTFTFNRRENIVDNSKNSRPEHTLLVPLI